MKVSVVILNYNGRGFLEQFLPDVIRYSNGAEVVVADNSSTDGSVLYLANHFPDIKLIRFNQNYGFAGGYNLALKEISSEYCLLLNSDVQVTANYLKILYDYMENNPYVAACQPKIRSFSDPKKFEYAGGCGGYIDEYCYPFCRGRIFDSIETDNGQYDDIADVFWSSGACMLVRMKDFWSVGGFDSNFFAHQEEIDLCWRLKAQQKRISCVPQSTVYHVGGGSLQYESPFKTYLNFRNNLLMIYKNIDDKKLRKVLAVRCLLDILAAFNMFLHFKFGNAFQVFKARKDFKKMRSQYKNFRNSKVSYYTDNENNKIHRGLLIYKYYIKKIKTFDKLY
jgi:GT2 family glycosyltransferase